MADRCFRVYKTITINLFLIIFKTIVVYYIVSRKRRSRARKENRVISSCSTNVYLLEGCCMKADDFRMPQVIIIKIIIIKTSYCYPIIVGLLFQR